MNPSVATKMTKPEAKKIASSIGVSAVFIGEVLNLTSKDNKNVNPIAFAKIRSHFDIRLNNVLLKKIE